jgi:hypothetical protein
MSLKYKNKRREIQENLSIDSYVFLSYYISNAKHIHSISGDRVTRVKISHLVASLRTSCIRTACPKLSTRLEQAVNNL